MADSVTITCITTPRTNRESDGSDIEIKSDPNYKICEQLLVDSHGGGVLCELCSEWFRKVCEKISKGEYEQMAALDVMSHWFCHLCINKFEELRKENKTLKNENTRLKDNKLPREKLDPAVRELDHVLHEGKPN